jgi:hypothetical protein
MASPIPLFATRLYRNWPSDFVMNQPRFFGTRAHDSTESAKFAGRSVVHAAAAWGHAAYNVACVTAWGRAACNAAFVGRLPAGGASGPVPPMEKRSPRTPNLEPEIRNPKSDGRKKSAARRPNPKVGARVCPPFFSTAENSFRISEFRLLSDFGDSGFGIRVEGSAARLGFTAYPYLCA